MTDVQLERIAELLGCDADFGTIAAEITTRNRERDRMRKAIGDLRGLVARLQRIKSTDRIQYAHALLEVVVHDEAMSFGFAPETKQVAASACSALCWVLGCPAGEALQRALASIEKAIAAKGYRMMRDEFNSRN